MGIAAAGGAWAWCGDCIGRPPGPLPTGGICCVCGLTACFPLPSPALFIYLDRGLQWLSIRFQCLDIGVLSIANARFNNVLGLLTDIHHRDVCPKSKADGSMRLHAETDAPVGISIQKTHTHILISREHDARSRHSRKKNTNNYDAQIPKYMNRTPIFSAHRLFIPVPFFLTGNGFYIIMIPRSSKQLGDDKN
jgi:hypothetical protein